MSSPKVALTRAPEAISWQSVADWVEARSGILAIALCACLAGLSLAIAARRPFWYDEIITVLIARSPTIKDVLANFHLIYDQTPPLNTLIVRFVCSVLGWTEIAARLPSTIFLTAGLLLLFHQVRRLTNGLFGLATIGILLVTFLPPYAYEARPYALLFFASTLALWFWTSAGDVSAWHSKRNALLFGLSMMLAISAHYYAVLLILPFAADELRSRGLRAFLSGRLLCGVAGIGLAIVVHLPFIRASSQMRHVRFWALPSFHNLQEAYTTMLLGPIFAFVCVVVLLAWAGGRATRSVGSQTREERLGWLFLIIPIAGYILGELITHAFTERYFIPMLAGIGLAAGCFLFRYYRISPQVPLIVLLLTIPLFLENSASRVLYASTPAISGRTEISDFIDDMLPRIRKDKKSFVLVSTNKPNLEARYYTAYPQMLRTLRSPQISDVWLASGALEARYFSMDDVHQHAREIAFIDPRTDLLDQLEKWGFHIYWRMTKPEPIVYAN